jgi:folate-binding protein YgfZ
VGTAHPTLASLPPFGHLPSDALGYRLFVRRVDLLGAPGYLLSVPRQGLVELWQTLRSAGVSPGGSAAFHALRIEARMPLYGKDISDDNLAQEVGRTQQAISFKKGCYLGQEPIARLDALGHVNRELCGLRIESEHVPPPGTVVSADGQNEIGRITSSALSYADHRAVALAYLRAGHTRPGTAVRLQLTDATVVGTVF